LLGPTGSAARHKSAGFVARQAKRLITSTPPNVMRRAKPMHLRMVASLCSASAVLGLFGVGAARKAGKETDELYDRELQRLRARSEAAIPVRFQETAPPTA
jgi:hypothetical protein